jgi:hypothetical protein
MPECSTLPLATLSSLNCHALRYTHTVSRGDLELGGPRLRHSRDGGAAAVPAAVSAYGRWYLGGYL